MVFFDHGHEQIVCRQDRHTGLRAIFALHSTVRGPAAGGCRYWVYENDAAALADALRLARGMTYKNALADLPFGGGKCVILGLPGERLSPAQLELFGTWVEDFGGRFVTAEDVGMRVADMRIVARTSRHVSGLGRDGVGGDPSPMTALGVLHGIEAAVRMRLGRETLEGLSVAVQGLGNVGYRLCELLHARGAWLVVADLDQTRVALVCEHFAARAVTVNQILSEAVDVLAPCALGGVLTKETVGKLRTSVIAGAANNQLGDDSVGALLFASDVLYAPDYVINAGGVISVAHEYLGLHEDSWVAERVTGITERLDLIFEQSRVLQRPTNEVADQMAERAICASPTPPLQVVA